MDKYKTHLFCIIGGIIIGVLVAMGVHRCHRQPVETKVERDTIVHYDTIAHWYPKPVGVTKTKTEYRWLTRVEHLRDTTKMIDSVLVEVPITSKHYSSSEYDAWVSGYEPSLDSIKVYQRTQMITEIRTISKQPNKWELDVVGGIDYGINSKQWLPYAGGELTLNRHKRLQLGIGGGVKWRDKAIDPYAEIKAKFRLY